MITTGYAGEIILGEYPDPADLTQSQLLDVAGACLRDEDFGPALFYSGYAVRTGKIVLREVAESDIDSIVNRIEPLVNQILGQVEKAESIMEYAQLAIFQDVFDRVGRLNNTYFKPNNFSMLAEEHSPHGARLHELGELYPNSEI
jgi:hypothetical protein